MTPESHETKRSPERREVLDVIERHLDGLEFEIQEEISKGDDFWFLSGMTKDGSREYTYQSKSKRTGEPVAPAVHVAYFVDGIPVGGKKIHSF
jgi:hypothetical protein